MSNTLNKMLGKALYNYNTREVWNQIRLTGVKSKIVL